MRLRFFSKTPCFCPYQLTTIHTPGFMANILRKNKFILADHFLDTLHKNKQNDWRQTQHQLILAQTICQTVGFAGVEIGEGEVIQRYIGESEKQILKNKTCFLHAMEVIPEHRGLGIHMLLWKKLCEQAMQNNIQSIIWEPVNEEAFQHFFAKFNLAPERHLLTQVSYLGEFFDGEDSTHSRFNEDILTIFQLEQKNFFEFHKKLEMAIQQLEAPKTYLNVNYERKCSA